jgi:hypothetical protein
MIACNQTSSGMMSLHGSAMTTNDENEKVANEELEQYLGFNRIRFLSDTYDWSQYDFS